jgi:Methyltransferase domain
MWKKSFKIFLGCNGAAIIKGLRLGPVKFLRGSLRSFDACDPLEKDYGEAARLLANIPEVTLLYILANRKPSIQLTVQNYEDGMLPLEHAIALLAIAVVENPKEVFEIGTFCGHTTKLLAQNLSNALIHTIDLPPDFSPENDFGRKIPKDDFHLIRQRTIGREYKTENGSERIIQHYGDTADWDFSLIANANFFFIDGSHTYEYCKNDSEKCYLACAGKGTFVWHDCDLDHLGVLKFLQEWRALGRNIVRIRGTSLAYWKAV